MDRSLRWGILSTAAIAGALIEPLRHSRRNTLLAVASREKAKADLYARKHKIPRAHGSYEALLADPEIDVVYNPLPNSLHAEWTLRALRAGKHVLCEKPLALSVAEVEAMKQAAEETGKVVSEAFMYRPHAQTCKVRELIAAGRLGRVRLVRGSFTYQGTEAGNYRLDPGMGGGALWDVGCYPVSYARFALGLEPEEAFGWQTLGETGVDETFALMLRFPEGILLQADCSMAAPHHVFMEFVGEEAALVVPQPFNPGPRNRLFLAGGGKREMVEVRGTATYVGEVEAMADAILEEGAPPVSLADSLGNVRALQALLTSAREGRAVRLHTPPG